MSPSQENTTQSKSSLLKRENAELRYKLVSSDSALEEANEKICHLEEVISLGLHRREVALSVLRGESATQ